MQISESSVGYVAGALLSLPLAVKAATRFAPLPFAHGNVFGVATLISAFVVDKLFDRFYSDASTDYSKAQMIGRNILSLFATTLISLVVAETIGFPILAATAAKIVLMSYLGGLCGALVGHTLGSKPEATEGQA